MENLSLYELRLRAQNRNTSDYENKYKEDSIKALIVPKPETKPKPKPKQTPTTETKLKPETKLRLKLETILKLET